MKTELPTIELASAATNPLLGRVAWSPIKSGWYTGMTLIALVGGPLTFTWQAGALFLGLSAATLCLGHSLGMHRKLIHRSYDCPKWLEYSFVYLGALVGMAGPFGLMRTHDTRDWAQRQSACHDFFAHRQPFWRDAWWQLHCDIQLVNPPYFVPPPDLARDHFYKVLEKTWMLQQLFWALLLGWLGGVGWVIWGICVRVSVSLTGHWLIGHFAHRQGQRTYHVDGACVQGYNVRWSGLITFGECWHNNHHAYPGSAKLGLRPNQLDPGWGVLCALRAAGLVWNIKLPQDIPARKQLRLFRAVFVHTQDSSNSKLYKLNT